MTHVFRLLQFGIASLFQKRLSDFGDLHEVTFRVLPWDIDIFLHMNNSKYLSYMEAVRWGVVFRAGFFYHAFKKGWILPIAKIDIRYLRPLRFWQKFSVSAQIIALDARWVYVHQVFTSNGKIVSNALVRSAVASKTGLIPPHSLLAEMGMPTERVVVPPEIQDWFHSFSSDDRMVRRASSGR